MRVYLDSRDLIGLLDHQSSEAIDQLRRKMLDQGQELVLSLHNIIEISAPLNHRTAKTSVMRRLVTLESLPHAYIADARVHAQELKSAIDSFPDREYASIDPYVARFDQVVAQFTTPSTEIYLQYGLAQTVFELWQADPTVFEGYEAETERLRALITADRARPDHAQHDRNFPRTVERNLSLYGLDFDRNGVGVLANWIWEDPSRCPAMRLGYEVFHKLVRNVADVPNTSDIPDLVHIDCLPYVDRITLDRRMRGYVRQVDGSMNTDYSSRVYKDFRALGFAAKVA